jgi:hypothetical protein
VTTKRGVLSSILAIGLAAAAVIVYFGPRLSLERRLEKRLNALREVEDAQLSLPSAPLVGRSGDDSYARATLAFDPTRDGVSYAPMELNLSSFHFYENDQCPERRRYLVGAARGQGATWIHQHEVAEMIGPSGFRDVDIFEEHLRLVLEAGADPIDIDESAARIRPNDIAGDILLEVPEHDRLLIRLPEPVDGVKFQDLRFVDRAIALRFSLIDPELFCA